MSAFIDIVEVTHTKDPAGFAISHDTVLASVRAYREDRHGTKIWANRAAFSTATSLFRFRVIPGVTITPQLVILCSGERFRILSAEDARGRGMYIECLCDHIEASKG
jgi:head-tail adaptor